MTEAVLTPDRILDATEECLRRYGPQKTTVVDVAKALDVSHGAIYRHYPSKEALREAVVRRWLFHVEGPLQLLAEAPGDPVDRLRRWLNHLIHTKREKVLQEPGLFETYCSFVRDLRNIHEVIQRHIDVLKGQLVHIIEDGMQCGLFHVDSPTRAATAVFSATARFHHPAHAHEWHDRANIDADYEAVLDLLLAGLGLAKEHRLA
ncbi:MAG TPA: TetR family transcriptional regulator [Candidatus Xenobia bacterium]|jgi:AcrR family transcriptional regulator